MPIRFPKYHFIIHIRGIIIHIIHIRFQVKYLLEKFFASKSGIAERVIKIRIN